MNNLPPVLLLMGPTASGKTDVACALADQIDCDLISVDSALIYRDMNIGSAKPDAETLARYPHALVDILDPAESYSAADFRLDTLRLIEQSHKNNRLPVLVGGTMLYYKVLLEGIADIPATEPAVRAQITQEAERLGWPAMHARLAEVDPVSAAKLHPNHSQRISRALEVFTQTGRPLSAWHSEQSANELTFRPIQIALMPEREVLHQRIETRFDKMLAHGFIEEVKGLVDRGDLHLDLPSMRAVGYRQIWQYVVGDIDLRSARDAGIAATRQLAKRQVTWLRSWPDLNFIATEEPFSVEHVLREVRRFCLF